MGTGSGFGKVILFNEHFVVYGIPAIASAINAMTETVVERVNNPNLLKPSGTEGSMADAGWVLEDQRPANPGYKTTKLKHQKESVNLIFQAAGFDAVANPIRVHMAGGLKAVGGVGASAAVCVSLARALNDEFKLGYDDDKINKIAYEGEKAYAGTPSGIDNTASTFGGLIRFEKNMEGGPNTITTLKPKEPIRIVMGNSGLTANTKAAVAGVRERRDANPEKYEAIFKDARDLAEQAQVALMAHDLEEVGRLMNKNHELLLKIEVSHPKLNELVKIARENGAIGAKMTGGGLGGYMVALTPDKETQDKVAAAMDAAGYEGHKRMIV